MAAPQKLLKYLGLSAAVASHFECWMGI